MSDPQEAVVIGREYLRVSYDRSGRARSNDEQHQDNLDAAPGLGISNFGDPYIDIGSASRHARKKRLDFGRLLDDLDGGRFGADVLLIWESSRGSRKVSEWCQLIESCEAVGVKIAVTTHSRVYDPSNPRDRRSLQEDAVDAEYESEKTRGRVKRAVNTSATDGAPHGRTPFGYRRYVDQETRKVKQVPDPDEAPIVVEMFTRVAAGHSLIALSRDLTARGIVSRKGVPFGPQTIRWMLLAPLYRGKRVHSPGTSAQRLANPQNLYDAAWESLVSDELWFAVESRLRDPARITQRPGRGKHLLSMIATCDKCGGPLSATYRHKGKRRYQCQQGAHLLIDADKLDTWAESEVLGLLTRPDLVERLMPEPVNPEALNDARDEVARIRAEHQYLIAEVGAGRSSAAMMAAEPAILARLRLAESMVKELTTPAGLRQLIDPGPQVVQQWEKAPMEAKREIVRLLFRPGMFGSLSIARAEKGKWSDVRGRIRLDGKSLPGW